MKGPYVWCSALRPLSTEMSRFFIKIDKKILTSGKKSDKFIKFFP